MDIVKVIRWDCGEKEGIVKIELKNVYELTDKQDVENETKEYYENPVQALKDERSHNRITITTVSGDHLTVKELNLLLLKSSCTGFLRDIVRGMERWSGWRPIAIDWGSAVIPTALLSEPEHSNKYALHWKIVEQIDRGVGAIAYNIGPEFYISSTVCTVKGCNEVYNITDVWLRDLYDMVYYFSKLYPNLVFPEDTIWTNNVNDMYHAIVEEFKEPFLPHQGLEILPCEEMEIYDESVDENPSSTKKERRVVKARPNKEAEASYEDELYEKCEDVLCKKCAAMSHELCEESEERELEDSLSKHIAKRKKTLAELEQCRRVEDFFK